MMPLLQPNDVIYYKKTTFVRCQPNDIIMVKKNHQLFTHRVIYKTKNYLITKGDNNLTSDGKIYPHQIIGKVYQVKRNGKIFNPESLYLLQSSLYFKEIIKIKTAFEMLGINFVFLKGLPLHLYFERKPPQRIYFDCDVLIERKDFKKAENILKKFGYKKAESALSSAQKTLKDKEIEASYYKIVNNFPVVFDLHFEVVFMMTQLGKLEAFYPQRLIDKLTEDFLREKQRVIIQNSNFYFLSSVNLILYLALHFFHHNFQGAFRLELLDKIIRSVNKRHSERSEESSERSERKLRFTRSFDSSLRSSLRMTGWESLLQKIKKYHLQNFVYPVFVLLKKYYKTPLPKNFFHQIEPSNLQTLKLYNFKNLNIFDDEPRIKAGINRFKYLFFFSPNPLWKKALVFLNPQVIYSVLWTLKRRLFSFLPNQKLLH